MSDSIDVGRVAQGPPSGAGVSGPVRGSKSRDSGEWVTEPAWLGGPCDRPARLERSRS